ncbi:MAG: glycosyltransferase [Actinomycetota bacterium]|nr:glycosyltransferase [Actinomycetota bacterium]
MNSATDVAFVVPMYNEAARWDPDHWDEVGQIPGVSFVFVDDGSTDRTRELVRAFAESRGYDTLLLDRNVGKAEAVRLGLLELLDRADCPPLVGIMDGDATFAPNDVRRLVDVARLKRAVGVEGICGARVALSGRAINRPASRHYIGRGIATLTTIAYRELPYDAQCGFKLFAANDDLRQCLGRPFATRWFFDVELLMRWKAMHGRTMRIWEEPVHEFSHRPGSKIRGIERARVALELARILGMPRALGPR